MIPCTRSLLPWPSAFDRDTGRLCAVASGPKAGTVLVSRDYVGETLDELVTSAEQPMRRPHVAGPGHAAEAIMGANAAIQGEGRFYRATEKSILEANEVMVC